MGRKATKAEKKARVEELADMVVKGYSQREMVRHIREVWGLSDDSAAIYIREARNVVKADLGDIDRADMLASKVQMLEQIARDSVASGRENNAIGAIRLLAELTGFGADLKK
jgi:ribosome-binding protein aMBF1 (putative translation factor)